MSEETITTHTEDDWHDGYPDEAGWYDCLYEGVECRLKCYYCQVRRKPKWLMKDGMQIADGVKWKGTASQKY